MYNPNVTGEAGQFAQRPSQPSACQRTSRGVPYLSGHISQARLAFPGRVKHRRGVDEQIQPTKALLHSSRSRPDVLLSVHIQPQNSHPARVLLGHTPQLGRTVRAAARRNHRGRVLISQDVFAELQPQSSAGSLDECDGGRHDCQLLRSTWGCAEEFDTLKYTKSRRKVDNRG